MAIAIVGVLSTGILGVIVVGLLTRTSDDAYARALAELVAHAIAKEALDPTVVVRVRAMAIEVRPGAFDAARGGTGRDGIALTRRRIVVAGGDGWGARLGVAVAEAAMLGREVDSMTRERLRAIGARVGAGS